MVKKILSFLLVNKNPKQTLAKNTFWLTFGNIFSRVFRGIFLIFAARALGVAEYGVFAYSLSLAGFFTLFSDIGLNTILTREIAKNKNETEVNQYFSTIFVLKTLLLIFTSLILIFITPTFSKIDKAKSVLPFMALLTLIDGIRDFCSSYFRGKEKMEFDALIISASNVAITFIGFFILITKPTAKILAISYTLASSVGLIIGLLLLKEKFKKIFSFFNKNLIKKILKSSLPIALLSIIGVFMTQIDILMLGFLKTEKEVGLYASAQKIILLIYVIPSIITSAFFPIFSKLAEQNDKEKTKNILEKALIVSTLISLPIICGGFILSENMINFIYGAEFNKSALAFKFLIFTVFPIFIGTTLGNLILAYDIQKKVAKNTFIGSIINVILNYALIPFLNIAGAALATLISQSVYNYLNQRTVKKEITPFKIFDKLNKIIIATLIMVIFTIIFKVLNIHILINILISAIIYILFLYFFKEKTILEIKNIFK